MAPLVRLEQSRRVVWPHYLQGPKVTKREPENITEIYEQILQAGRRSTDNLYWVDKGPGECECISFIVTSLLNLYTE